MQHDSPTTVGIFILRRKILHNQKAVSAIETMRDTIRQFREISDGTLDDYTLYHEIGRFPLAHVTQKHPVRRFHALERVPHQSDERIQIHGFVAFTGGRRIQLAFERPSFCGEPRKCRFSGLPLRNRSRPVRRGLPCGTSPSNRHNP